MAYLAIARKYRPSEFGDLVGQEHVVQTLKNAIIFNRVAHAYLFCGARGIGKTSVARIFAKALRCPNVKDAIPCNTCSECQLITDSRSVDVVEIDGASNNGVEAVRGIRENVAYGASAGFYKIYIIDEVHMLSISAFNALLKTLEEPPPHVIFVFATTEVQKIPLTILSRCQRFEFRRLTQTQIVSRLQQILSSEGFNLSEEALRGITAHADGSLRDALSLLDQVLSYYGEKERGSAALSEAQVVEALGVADSNAVRDFLAQIIQKNIPGVVKVVGDLYLSGVDLKHFAERCLEELRLLYLVSLGKETKQPLTAETLDISAGHFSEIEQLVKNTPLIQLERMSQIFMKTIQQLGWAGLPRYVLEMAAVRMSKLDALSKIEAAMMEGGKTQAAEVQLPPSPAIVASSPELDEPAEPAPPHLSAAPPPSLSDEPPPLHLSEPPPMAPPRFEESQTQSWRAFVDSVMKKRPLLGALLSHANFRMQKLDKGREVHLAFPPGSFFEKQAADQKNRSDIVDMVKAYFGPDTQFSLSSDLEKTSISLEESRRIEIDATVKRAKEHPAVVNAKEALGADIIDVTVES